MEQQDEDDGGISTSLRAVLDTSVLYPPYLRDTLLLAAETGLYQPIWSGLILAELRRNVLAQGIWPAKIERMIAMMNWKFPRAERLVPDPLIEQMTNAPEDRHVAALAVSAIARIVTANLRRACPLRCHRAVAGSVLGQPLGCRP